MLVKAVVQGYASKGNWETVDHHIKIYIVSKAKIRQYAPTLNQLPMTRRFNQENNQPDPGNFSLDLFISLISDVMLFLLNDQGIGQPLEQRNLGEAEEIEQRMQQLIRAEILPSNHQENMNCMSSFLLQISGIKRLEIRTALQLFINILPFWICTFPLSCCSMAMYWCIELRLNTSILYVAISYTRDLFLVHVIYNPVMYMCNSIEFQSAVVHLFQKLKGRCCKLKSLKQFQHLSFY